MAFNKELPEWKAAGIEPPLTKRNEGWKPGEKPPADWLNWTQNRTYEALKELQEKAVPVDSPTFTGPLTAPRLISTVATGTAPLTVDSETQVDHLNADMVNGFRLNQGVKTTDSPTFSGLKTDKLILPVRSSDPVSPEIGETWFRSDL
ncbi:hypothetical protein OB236_18790 [Paenibacillus sp. WQ 127069]|uniref:Uncharacterized protein n=1 Tax=Paenibacillus baimaensis TaxID=2982185 RepID=A0ABT2UHR1_9BACL|nr:hypothetical protein [Paenibacillus sp. WQ 127069]MCU6794155.1 hypothetical protein [Paenibacillus sp. WQ 127069]